MVPQCLSHVCRSILFVLVLVFVNIFLVFSVCILDSGEILSTSFEMINTIQYTHTPIII